MSAKLPEILDEARKHLANLIGEREAREKENRPSYPEDERIPREIVNHQYKLALYRNNLKESIKRSQAYIDEANKAIDEIEKVHGGLYRELCVAMHF